MIDFRRETIDAAAQLIAALNLELTKQYPEEGATHFRLDADEVADGRGALLVARREGVAIACGAVRLLDARTAELKRMYVIPAARGEGVSRQLLAALEQEARQLGATRLVLETGVRQVAALRLYESSGFVHIERYGEYTLSPLSRCLEKQL